MESKPLSQRPVRYLLWLSVPLITAALFALTTVISSARIGEALPATAAAAWVSIRVAIYTASRSSRMVSYCGMRVRASTAFSSASGLASKTWRSRSGWSGVGST